MSKEQQDRILADFAALDDARQTQLVAEAKRLAEQQQTESA
jgi:hypothetical protein